MARKIKTNSRLNSKPYFEAFSFKIILERKSRKHFVGSTCLGNLWLLWLWPDLLTNFKLSPFIYRCSICSLHCIPNIIFYLRRTAQDCLHIYELLLGLHLINYLYEQNGNYCLKTLPFPKKLCDNLNVQTKLRGAVFNTTKVLQIISNIRRKYH